MEFDPVMYLNILLRAQANTKDALSMPGWCSYGMGDTYPDDLESPGKIKSFLHHKAYYFSKRRNNETVCNDFNVCAATGPGVC